MRNLRTIHHLSYHDSLDRTPSAYCWDIGSNSVICTYGPTESDTLVELKRWPGQADHDSNYKPVSLIASWDAPSPLPDLSCDRVLNLQFFSDLSTICLVFAGGDIVLVREKPLAGEEKIEIVGSIDVGITAASWSPDEEVLIICARSDTILFMTRDFDNSQSIDLSEEDLRASKHVSVGWGKSETQFKGKGAKALRDPTVPETVDEGLPSSYEDNSTTISWRGDCQYVAVNSTQKTTRRVIRVYTRDGVLDGVTEPVDCLEASLSWRPSGSIIASIKRSSDVVQVVFFERNGLRHGQFPLRLSKDNQDSWASKITLCWNSDSTVLAVIFRDRIQLWTISNYQYYLKQEIHLSESTLSDCLPISWHPERSLTLVTGAHTGECSSFFSNVDLLIVQGDLHRLDLVACVARADTTTVNGHGVVAVVDGGTMSSLKIT